MARLILEDLGLSITVAQNGQEAVDLFEKSKFDLIFMDFKMPVLDGYEATALIRDLESKQKTQSAIPIVALTANTFTEDKLKCEKSGMNDVLTKPFTRYEIIKSLNQWMPNLVVNQDSLKNSLIKSPNNKNDTGVITNEVLDLNILEKLETSIKDIEQGVSSLTDVSKLTSELELNAHSIKAPSAYIGAMKINLIAKNLEAALIEINVAPITNDIINMIKKLEHEFHILKKEVNDICL